MDLYSRIKNFLGLSPNTNQGNSYTDSETSRTNTKDDFMRDAPTSSEPFLDDHNRFGFNVFTNPLEIHRYFEHQMNEMMKSFGIFGGDSPFFGNRGDLFHDDNWEPFFGDSPYGNNTHVFQFPAIEEFHDNGNQPSSSLRDQYLKPGYEHVATQKENKTDSDIDGKIDIGDLGSVLRGKQSTQPRSFFYGQSMSTKTVRNADGSIETHKVVKDGSGNEEVTVTKKIGDKEYSVTTRTDKEGRKEVVENLVNMDEKDKDLFLRGGQVNKSLTDSDRKPQNPDWFPFDKFFK